MIGEVSGCWNSLIPMTYKHIEGVQMSMQKIIAIADSLVKGWEVKIPALKATEWDELRWWLDYLKGYDI